MKKLIILWIASVFFMGNSWVNAQEITPYIKVGESPKTMEQTELDVVKALEGKGFEIIGQYHVGNDQTLKVIVYSRNDLQAITLNVKDRGALAAALKVGLKADGPNTSISYLNPEYLFQAYLMDAYDTHSVGLKKIEADIAASLSPLGDENNGFGGAMTAEDLREYHYKIMMPYFSDPVELKEFTSFEEGVQIIEKNLAAKKGSTEMVYSLVFQDKKTAVYGVALLDDETGEKSFLPTIGVDHLAAMPYEIILENNTATILHGRYRLALHWPELTMGTFMKIRSAPGDIKDALENLCE